MLRRSYRGFFQFRLRTVLVALTAIGVACGWYVVRARKQQELYAAIYRSNSSAYYDYQIVDGEYDPQRESFAPPWLEQRLGSDMLHSVVKVHLLDEIENGKPTTDQVDSFCKELDAFPRLRDIRLSFATDERLESIGRLPYLQRLEIAHGRWVTDQGIESLANVSHMRHLDLREVRLSGRGLRAIGRMARLEVLYLDAYAISDEDLTALGRLSHLRELRLSMNYSRVTDGGLIPLSHLSKLEFLSLEGTLIADEGLMHLAPLSRLTELRVNGPNVGDGKAIGRALPHCQVTVVNTRRLR